MVIKKHARRNASAFGGKKIKPKKPAKKVLPKKTKAKTKKKPDLDSDVIFDSNIGKTDALFVDIEDVLTPDTQKDKKNFAETDKKSFWAKISSFFQK